jgi:mannose-6-phosphate isomerase-like protein (cupin superfamily)
MHARHQVRFQYASHFIQCQPSQNKADETFGHFNCIEYSESTGMKSILANASGFVPASHEDPQNPGVLKRVIATKEDFQAGHVQMLNWARLPAGSSFQLHYHEDMQEVFVLVKGEVEMKCAGVSTPMRPGDTVFVEAREPHQMFNHSPVDAEYIVFGISSERGGKTVVIGKSA